MIRPSQIDQPVVGAKEYESQAARDARDRGYGGESYWQYLDDHACELRDKYLAKGDELKAKEMMEQSLGEALRGNDGL